MSTMKHTRSSIDSMVTSMVREKRPVVNVLDLEPMSVGGFARVTASVTHTSASRADNSVALAAVCSTLQNKLRPVEGSFHVIASNSISDTITGVFSSNPETRVAPDDMKGYRAVAGNMFMDDEETMWALRKTAAGDILVKSRSGEDADILSELNASLCGSSSAGFYEATASSSRLGNMRDSVEGGDFIMYVDPNKDRTTMGAVVASVVHEESGDVQLSVIAHDGGAATVIDRGMVVASFDDVEFDSDGLYDENEVTAGAGKTIDEVAAFYRIVFQRDPAYFAKFMERWKSHVFA